MKELRTLLSFVAKVSSDVDKPAERDLGLADLRQLIFQLLIFFNFEIFFPGHDEHQQLATGRCVALKPFSSVCKGQCLLKEGGT